MNNRNVNDDLLDAVTSNDSNSALIAINEGADLNTISFSALAGNQQYDLISAFVTYRQTLFLIKPLILCYCICF